MKALSGFLFENHLKKFKYIINRMEYLKNNNLFKSLKEN
jgi:hypothetical protein